MNQTLNLAQNFYKELFGQRVQKIPVDAGFSCPNRDGTKSVDGCSYCCNESFSPFYCDAKETIESQLEKGIAFYSKKYKVDRFLAYFQTYSGTHASAEKLEQIYYKTLENPQIEGLVIATRPDCIDSKKLDLIETISKKCFVKIEYGIESLNDDVLTRINRCHTSKEALKALKQTTQRGILTGAHIIIGLPGETYSSLLETIKTLNQTGIQFLKLHHLQIIEGAVLAQKHKTIEVPTLSLEEYIEISARLIANLRADIFLERFINRVPLRFLIAPRWQGIDEPQFLKQLISYMNDKKLTQGCLCETNAIPNPKS